MLVITIFFYLHNLAKARRKVKMKHPIFKTTAVSALCLAAAGFSGISWGTLWMPDKP
jgi:hypothetical protein